jgi:hypothetical protein
VGAIRWWHGEAVVDQLFVHKDHRNHLGTVLVYATSAFHQFNDGGHLHSDGRRTTWARRWSPTPPRSHLQAGQADAPDGPRRRPT